MGYFMLRLLTYRYWKMALLAASIILLAACSATRLAYNNLDWLIRWKVGDYVSLDRAQKQWLSSRIEGHLDWHCRSELPQYLPLLDDLGTNLYTKHLDPSVLMQGLPNVEASADRLIGEITPTLIGLMRQLDARQVQELTKNLQEKQNEMNEKYLEPDLLAQNRDRIERAQDRLEDWTGPLNEPQQALLTVWSAELEGQNQIWLQNRQAWQSAFVDTVNRRDQPDFAQHITDLMMDRERFWTADFKRIAATNTERGAQLITDLMQLSSNKQQRHLSKRLAGIRADIQALQCTDA
ncbi:MAG: hypothetical protein ACJAXR_002780 [Halopseudomonas sp.]|jgi:hypothetical protein